MARKEENSKKVVERKKANLDDGIVFDEDDEGDKKEWNRNWNGNESSHPHRRKSTQVNHGHGGHGKDQIKKKIK